ELANVFRRKLKQKEVLETQVVQAMLAERLAIKSFIPSVDLIDDAWQIAQQLDHPVYDCVYLACAIPAGVLATADEGFIGKCESAGYGRFVCLAPNAVERLAQRSVDRLGQPLFEIVERLSARIDETFESLRASVASESGLVGF